MPRRKFKVDKQTGRVIEFTKEDVRAVCEEISQGTQPFQRNWLEEDSVPSNTRRNCRAKWPIHSEAMGVDPEDVPRAQAILREHGVHTDYDRLSRPILRDASHRKAHCKVMGYYDRSAGYADQAPEHFTG